MMNQSFMEIMPTHPQTWKKAENRVAALFGSRRQVLSGSCGRDNRPRSDTTHPRLFVEAKSRERHTARTLFEETKALARKEGKTPIVALFDKGRPGFLLCIHSDDLSVVAAEFFAAHPEPTASENDQEPNGSAPFPTFGGQQVGCLLSDSLTLLTSETYNER